MYKQHFKSISQLVLFSTYRKRHCSSSIYTRLSTISINHYDAPRYAGYFSNNCIKYITVETATSVIDHQIEDLFFAFCCLLSALQIVSRYFGSNMYYGHPLVLFSYTHKGCGSICNRKSYGNSVSRTFQKFLRYG